MTNNDDLLKFCRKALYAEGDCPRCRGEGTFSGMGTGGSYRSETCGNCAGSGHDPRAVLRAVQAVGLLLYRQIQGVPLSPPESGENPADPAP